MAAVNDENSFNAPNITTRGRGAKAAALKSKVPDAADEVPVKGEAKAATKVDADAETQQQSVTDVTSVRVLLRVRPMSASDMRLGYHSEFVSCTDTRCVTSASPYTVVGSAEQCYATMRVVSLIQWSDCLPFVRAYRDSQAGRERTCEYILTALHLRLLQCFHSDGQRQPDVPVRPRTQW